MSKDYDKKTKEDANKFYDDILKEADYKNKEIESFYEKRKVESEKVFKAKKENLVKEFFKKIIE